MVVDQRIGAHPQAADLSVARVLVVDDEETVMVTIKGILELDGYAVTATAMGEHALELVRSEPFDVVLTDLRLDDGIDGLEILRELRQHSVDAVGVMLTGYASLDSAVSALRAGAYDYLIKPCDVLELRMAVSRGVERSRMAGQLRERVRDLEQANETIRALNLELEQRVAEATAGLREQIDERDEFIATVSHDLKSPLTFIKGMANLRRRRAARSIETEPLISALEQIESSAGRMAQQLDAIVDSSRLESGRPLELHREPTDIVALANKAIAERQAMSDRHVLDVTSSEPRLIGNWDQLRLGRVLDNLLDNAVKYSPRGGAIEVLIRLDSEDAVISVRDRGEGIPPSDLPHVFERFRRGKNVEGRIPGTGIGLHGVRQLIELHHGSITAESQLGEGTTMTMRLPLQV
jgi:signal transduction histidine kinase